MESVIGFTEFEEIIRQYNPIVEELGLLGLSSLSSKDVREHYTEIKEFGEEEYIMYRKAISAFYYALIHSQCMAFAMEMRCVLYNADSSSPDVPELVTPEQAYRAALYHVSDYIDYGYDTEVIRIDERSTHAINELLKTYTSKRLDMITISGSRRVVIFKER